MTTTSGRLLALLSLLQARRDWPGPLLAQRLEVSPRTVRRDVDRLRGLGYPIAAAKGPDGGYRLAAGSDLPPLLFDDDQAVALAVALQVVGSSGADIGEAAERALATVRQVMPSRLRHRVDAVAVDDVRARSTAPGPEVRAADLAAIGSAVRSAEVLRFDYASPHGEESGAPRHVEPHHLVTWGRRWYVVGWDAGRDDWRVFRVDRMTLRSPHGPRFVRRTLPGGDVASFVTSRFRGAGPSGQWPCRGEVVMDLPAHQVTPYAPEAVVVALGPDRCRVVLGSWSWTGLAASLARFDADLEVVAPPELAEAFRTLGRRCLAAADEKTP